MSKSMDNYTLTLEGEGVTVSREVSGEQARRVLNIIMGSETIISHPAATSGDQKPGADHNNRVTTALPASAHAQSLREYLDTVGAKKNTEKILAMASYFTESTGSADFSSDEIKAFFPKAAEKMPGNYNRDFRWVISNAWIAEDIQNKGRYYITQTGKKALSEQFPKELSKPQPGYTKRKKKQTTKGQE